jgi:4-diphosphocytidyl-2-C-methyl-D-erythritol kinase
MTVKVNAYAKINLFLDIESVRDDGYHDILSLMQNVSLYDVVTVSFYHDDKASIYVKCSDQSIRCDESNLAYKAAALYPADVGRICINIEKRIPVSAGLAGGSADAAATLIALNEIFGKRLSIEELKMLGQKIGADVPFCIDGGSCLAQGTGDILTPMPSMPNCYIVIAKKGEGMSTPRAYAALDEKYNRFKDYETNKCLLNVLLNADHISKEYCSGLFNIFESVVEYERAEVPRIKNMMIESGALAAMMSGSGTSVFGIFESKSDAERALDILLLYGAEAFLCVPKK